MDEKERYMIESYHKKVINGNFDEMDIYSFLMLLRSHSQVASPVREFGDFIAHREKDRGKIRDYLYENKKTLESVFELNSEGEVVKKTGDGTNKYLISKDVYEIEEVKKSFNSIFKSIGLSNFSTRNTNDVMLCIMSLLQKANLLESRNNKFGWLEIGYSEEEIILLGKFKFLKKYITFPILTVKNLYINLPDNDEFKTIRSLDNGKLIESKLIEIISSPDGVLINLIPQFDE